MMCQRIGRPPTSTIGFGRYSVSSRSRVPSPPASSTTFMDREPNLPMPDDATGAMRSRSQSATAVRWAKPTVMKFDESNRGTDVVGNSDDLRRGAPSRFVVATQYAAVRLFGWSGSLRRKVANAGEIANYLTWLRERFGD